MITTYVTMKRPKTEPYEIWKERRRLQQRDLKLYLKGVVFWPSKVKGTYTKEAHEAIR